MVPGFEDFNRRSASRTGSGCRTRRGTSAGSRRDTGKANFTVNELSWLPVPPGRLILQTMRCHDQYNTTIYGLDDRYRGVKGGRRVLFIAPEDIAALGLRRRRPGGPDLRVDAPDGTVQERRATTSGWCLPDAAAGTPPPTTRRPTR